MKIGKSHRRRAWPFLALVLVLAIGSSATLAAATAPAPAVGRGTAGNRLSVLALGEAADSPVIAALQRQFDDHARVHTAPEFASPAGALAQSSDWLRRQVWAVVYLGFRAGADARADDAAALGALFEQAKATGAVVIWGTTPATASADEARIVAHNDTARTLARQKGVAVCDLFALQRARRTAAPLPAEVTAAEIARLAYRGLLEKSSPYAELPATETRDPRRLLADEATLRPAALPALPVPAARTSMVYRAAQGEWQFNLHSYLAHHDGKFWAIWSSGRADEDSSSQLLRYATSADGHTWSEAKTLAEDPDGEAGPQRWMASGLVVEDGRLVAYGTRSAGHRGREYWADAQALRFVWDNGRWRQDAVIANDCALYYPPLRVAGRDFVVWRNSYAHFATAIAPAGTWQWQVTPIPGPFPVYRLSETSHYVDAHGVMHLIIRDQGASGFIYRALSYDAGATWTIPVKTNFPDGRSKNFADRLSNGWYYLISNPKNDGPPARDPLTIALSRDGWTFGTPKVVRRGGSPVRYAGKAKGNNSFQYAHALEHAGQLWVIYATNKEDIEVTAIPLSELVP